MICLLHCPFILLVYAAPLYIDLIPLFRDILPFLFGSFFFSLLHLCHCFVLFVFFLIHNNSLTKEKKIKILYHLLLLLMDLSTNVYAVELAKSSAILASNNSQCNYLTKKNVQGSKHFIFTSLTLFLLLFL